jgi:chromosome segregation ATPase
LSSSITTSTSRANKKGGRLGINLNSLLENLTQNQVQRMAEDPERLKAMMRECKQTILRMEGIITEQNKELELSIKALEDLQERLEEKDEAISRLEDKMAQLR